jgi:hypothetical protein
MRTLGERASHVAMKVQVSSPDLALCHVSTEQCGVRMLCNLAFSVPQPSGEGECQLPARTAPVPSSKIGLDQVHDGKSRGLQVQSPTVICAVSHLRLSARRRAVHAKAAHPCAAPDCFACSEPTDQAGASIKVWWESRTAHGMTATPDGREEVALNRSSPNNRIERGVTHKVLRRGRVSVVLGQVLRARVRDASACARSCERWAA